MLSLVITTATLAVGAAAGGVVSSMRPGDSGRPSARLTIGGAEEAPPELAEFQMHLHRLSESAEEPSRLLRTLLGYIRLAAARGGGRPSVCLWDPAVRALLDASPHALPCLRTAGFCDERRDQSGAPFLFARRVRRPFLAAIEAACEHAIALAERDEEAETRADERVRDASQAVGSAAPPGAEVRPPPLERQGAAVRSGGPMLRAERSARRWPQPANLLAAADGDGDGDGGEGGSDLGGLGDGGGLGGDGDNDGDDDDEGEGPEGKGWRRADASGEASGDASGEGEEEGGIVEQLQGMISGLISEIERQVAREPRPKRGSAGNSSEAPVHFRIYTSKPPFPGGLPPPIGLPFMPGGPSGGDDEDGEVPTLERRLRAASLPAEAEEVVTRELRRLRRMSPMHSEYSTLVDYLEWMAELPWAPPESPQPPVPLSQARAQLEEDHYAMDKVSSSAPSREACMTEALPVLIVSYEWTRSSSASSSSSPSATCAETPRARSSACSVRPASARPRAASPGQPLPRRFPDPPSNRPLRQDVAWQVGGRGARPPVPPRLRGRHPL